MASICSHISCILRRLLWHAQNMLSYHSGRIVLASTAAGTASCMWFSGKSYSFFFLIFLPCLLKQWVLGQSTKEIKSGLILEKSLCTSRWFPSLGYGNCSGGSKTTLISSLDGMLRNLAHGWPIGLVVTLMASPICSTNDCLLEQVH